MTDVINTREIVLAVLTEVLEEDKYSHIVLREVLEKYQYLEKRDRSFITRVAEGTLENLIEMDYIISQFSSVKVSRMKPVIRNHPADVGLSVEIYGFPCRILPSVTKA